MDIERHESFTITLTLTEAWNLWSEVQELNGLRDSGDVGDALTGNLVTLREIAGTFALRKYLMDPPENLRSPGAEPVPPPLSEQERHDRLRPQDTRKWTG